MNTLRRSDPVLFILLMTLAMISQLRKRGKRRFPRKKEINGGVESLPLHFENRIEIFGFVYGMKDGKRIRRKN